jgi:hypothetical protein
MELSNIMEKVPPELLHHPYASLVVEPPAVPSIHLALVFVAAVKAGANSNPPLNTPPFEAVESLRSVGGSASLLLAKDSGVTYLESLVPASTSALEALGGLLET